MCKFSQCAVRVEGEICLLGISFWGALLRGRRPNWDGNIQFWFPMYLCYGIERNWLHSATPSSACLYVPLPLPDTANAIRSTRHSLTHYSVSQAVSQSVYVCWQRKSVNRFCSVLYRSGASHPLCPVMLVVGPSRRTIITYCDTQQGKELLQRSSTHELGWYLRYL